MKAKNPIRIAIVRICKMTDLASRLCQSLLIADRLSASISAVVVLINCSSPVAWRTRPFSGYKQSLKAPSRNTKPPVFRCRFGALNVARGSRNVSFGTDGHQSAHPSLKLTSSDHVTWPDVAFRINGKAACIADRHRSTAHLDRVKGRFRCRDRCDGQRFRCSCLPTK